MASRLVPFSRKDHQRSKILLIFYWGLSKIMVPENCPYAALSRTFRAPAESGHGIMIRFSFIYKFINSGIQAFRKPYAALSRPFATAAKHVHICRCHSDTKSLAWVLGGLPYDDLIMFVGSSWPNPDLFWPFLANHSYPCWFGPAQGVPSQLQQPPTPGCHQLLALSPLQQNIPR